MTAPQNQPKERPILFSATMVRAILAGRKTQTRRIIRNARGEFWEHAAWTPRVDADGILWESFNPYHAFRERRTGCPYGLPGDLLWVKETWQALEDSGHGYHLADPKPGAQVRYRATDEAGWIPALPWRPSIQMPRWASRITLEIAEVRAQRLHDMTDSEARAEGWDGSLRAPIVWFASLWDSLNSARAPWASNPWVWAITFRLHSSKNTSHAED